MNVAAKRRFYGCLGLHRHLWLVLVVISVCIPVKTRACLFVHANAIIVMMTTTTKSVRPESVQKWLWNGPLFGRLPKFGRDYLVERGWEYLNKNDPRLSLTNFVIPTSNNSNGYHSSSSGRGSGSSKGTEDVLLEFIWPSKSGPQFPRNDSLYPARIRPFAKEVTDILDDKVRLAKLIRDSGIGPDCIVSLEDAKDHGELYFVKHRYGAQGKSVYVYDKAQLQSWFQKSSNVKDFIVQKEVLPALDEQGRKFVLRSHVLLVQRGGSTLRAYLNEDIICSPHASAYRDASASSGGNRKRSTYISQAGKRHPDPLLLEQLDPSSHPAASVYDQIQHCSETLLQCLLSCEEDNNHFSSNNNNNNNNNKLAEGMVCFALLGNDFLLDNNNQIKLCEVNSHPALGWGTMSQVPKRVFTRLIQDTLDIIVFDKDDDNHNSEHQTNNKNNKIITNSSSGFHKLNISG